MAAHFTHHSVITLAKAAEPVTAASPVKVEELDDASAMSFQNFDITQVLQQGTVLVASGGQVCPFTSHRLKSLSKRHCDTQLCQAAVAQVWIACTLQEYEMQAEEGTRAEQLAKQQKNLKMR